MRWPWRNEDPRTYQEVGPLEASEELRLPRDLLVSDLGLQSSGWPVDGTNGFTHRVDVHYGYEEAESMLLSRGYRVESQHVDGEGITVRRWARFHLTRDLQKNRKKIHLRRRDQKDTLLSRPEGDPHA